TLGSAYRLAKFNIDENQKDGFIGLPTPANTAWILSLPLILATTDMIWLQNLLTNQWFLIGCSVLSAYLMNANIPLFALKFKQLGWGKNKGRYLFIFGSLVLIAALQFVAIPIIILGYVLLSLVARDKF
ncbi:MAG: phosphatidylserine synthase, partial [Flavobacteriaceae bacterium]|nr:phosphatidylserine synthase [Flavobacteriaceae bacterium]